MDRQIKRMTDGWMRKRERVRESGYRRMQGFLSLKGFSEVGTPTRRASLRACCSQ